MGKKTFVITGESLDPVGAVQKPAMRKWSNGWLARFR
jgi:hypothetical protein